MILSTVNTFIIVLIPLLSFIHSQWYYIFIIVLYKTPILHIFTIGWRYHSPIMKSCYIGSCCVFFQTILRSPIAYHCSIGILTIVQVTAQNCITQLQLSSLLMLFTPRICFQTMGTILTRASIYQIKKCTSVGPSSFTIHN